MPVVTCGEVVAEGIEHRAVINAFPQVVGIVVIQRHGFLEVDLADLDMRTCGGAAEVEEQADGRSISTFLQGHTLTLEDKSVSRHIHTLLDEEVGVARVGEFEGHLRTVLISLHHKVEVVCL